MHTDKVSSHPAGPPCLINAVADIVPHAQRNGEDIGKGRAMKQRKGKKGKAKEETVRETKLKVEER